METFNLGGALKLIRRFGRSWMDRHHEVSSWIWLILRVIHKRHCLLSWPNKTIITDQAQAKPFRSVCFWAASI